MVYVWLYRYMAQYVHLEMLALSVLPALPETLVLWMNLHFGRTCLIKSLIFGSVATRFLFCCLLFIWELAHLGVPVVGSHPWFQLSFHSDAGGNEQFEPFKCKCRVPWVKVEEKGHNWGTACVSAFFSLFTLTTNTMTQRLLSQKWRNLYE